MHDHTLAKTGVFMIVVGVFMLTLGQCLPDKKTETPSLSPLMISHEKPRSGKWPAVRAEHLRREPACAVCGHTGKGLQVHHIKEVSRFPELELDDGNLITLCGSKEEGGRCYAHYWLGHCGEWRGFNIHVREDAALMKSRWDESARIAKESAVP